MILLTLTLVLKLIFHFISSQYLTRDLINHTQLQCELHGNTLTKNKKLRETLFFQPGPSPDRSIHSRRQRNDNWGSLGHSPYPWPSLPDSNELYVTCEAPLAGTAPAAAADIAIVSCARAGRPSRTDRQVEYRNVLRNCNDPPLLPIWIDQVEYIGGAFTERERKRAQVRSRERTLTHLLRYIKREVVGDHLIYLRVNMSLSYSLYSLSEELLSTNSDTRQLYIICGRGELTGSVCALRPSSCGDRLAIECVQPVPMDKLECGAITLVLRLILEYQSDL